MDEQTIDDAVNAAEQKVRELDETIAELAGQKREAARELERLTSARRAVQLVAQMTDEERAAVAGVLAS